MKKEETMKARDAYLDRMRTCRPFKSFGITPEWFPGTGDIEGFCHDEVVRQYHDTRVREDGGVRIEWMQAAWDYASRSAAQRRPTMMDVQSLGMLVEPSVNLAGQFRTMNVYIGSGIGAPPALVPKLMTFLVGRDESVEAVQGTRGHHSAEYRNLWRYNVLSDATVVSRAVEMFDEIETADDWYLAYEGIHPWGDGNGRTGKILHNWLLGTLDEPVLVHDYFGGGNP